ncbi:hypothetical protein ATJ97_2262 [Georgenia soli]|uniref:DUF4190 domain-containing protein n=1 Tax=Georgenia soli TaxID=638953 RepID=A0A2A9ENF4_9MICO|nr:DUF4190 domain-containing protein [Georgenia soli]PFG39749.1 hypothetical protein ATJ97_2262 [Georgenia soli]
MSENPYQPNQPQTPQGQYGSYNSPGGGYVPSAPPAYGYDATPQEAKSAATLSWVFGILGILLLPIVFGPLALWQAKKAERLGASATAGKVLGWISIALVIIGIIGAIILFVGMAADPSSF